MTATTVAPLSLTHVALPPRQAPKDGEKPPLLVLLHGVGSHEHDLLPLASYLDGRFQVVSVRAPLTHGNGGFAWYPVQFTPQGIFADETVAQKSRDRIVPFLDEAATAYHADRDRTFLMGFSQGAIMSLYTALTRPQTVTAIVPMSGRLLPGVQSEFAPNEQLQGLPIFAVHGLYDQVLPISEGRTIRDTLSHLPVNLTYKEYPMGHEVGPESLQDITDWLTEQLNQTEAK